MKTSTIKAVWLAAVSTAALALAGAAQADSAQADSGKPVFDSGVVSGLGARNIGSATMSGRISAIAGLWRSDHLDLYVGAASGGVWKSQDGGTTFKPVFDKQPMLSIGAIAIDPSHPDTVWVGTGESWMRNSVSIGDGVYKSTDGGQTWTHMGLPDLRAHLQNPGRSQQQRHRLRLRAGQAVERQRRPRPLQDDRRRQDLGLILKGANLSTGCSTLAMDPQDPNVLFAGMWDFRRKGWTFRSGGDTPDAPSGSALFRTTDGGKTWTKLDADSAKGLPKGPWGRLAVAIAPVEPQSRLCARRDRPHSALYISNDGGKTWTEGDRSQNMVWRPFYFANLIVDPTNPDRLFKPDFDLIVSEDGGKSFSSAPGRHPRRRARRLDRPEEPQAPRHRRRRRPLDQL